MRKTNEIRANKALHRPTIPLCSIVACEIDRLHECEYDGSMVDITNPCLRRQNGKNHYYSTLS
jgi:hypothetical protein